MAEPVAGGQLATPLEVMASLRAAPTTGHVRVALDAMGGDHGIQGNPHGSLLFCFGVEIKNRPSLIFAATPAKTVRLFRFPAL